MGKVMLPQSFLLTGLIGFLVVAVYGYYGKLSLPWATAFGLVFLLMVIASFISMAPKVPK
ncbi:hypothetical protein DRJ48_00550 [Candidatus Woesearchaeota archaeon]|nr:MAG: hypothetical protein DRJ48_00550 [Candidatus Woesearchaeota archaeon]